jgi:hypothetical protein
MNTKEKHMTDTVFAPGRYYIGDLCYVMHPEWDEFCDLTLKGLNIEDGVFTLKDGRKFASYTTAYGDGLYASNIGTRHSVDAGLIGCIRVEDIRDPESDETSMKSLGAIVEFDTPFTTSSDENGNIRFGHVVISTGDDDEEYDCFEDEEEYDV